MGGIGGIGGMGRRWRGAVASAGTAALVVMTVVLAVPASSSVAAAPVIAPAAAAPVSAAAPEAADPTTPIDVTKSGPATTLEGEPVRYTLTASNPTAAEGGVAQFNASFSDVLPAGVTYVPGSTEPSYIGDPTVATDPTPGPRRSSGRTTSICRRAIATRSASR